MCSYDDELKASLEAAPLVGSAAEAQASGGDVRLQYDSQESFQQLAAAVGIMQEWRDGVPRAAYHGVVTRAACPPVTLPIQASAVGRAVYVCIWVLMCSALPGTRQEA